jgi:hypothetical protein
LPPWRWAVRWTSWASRAPGGRDRGPGAPHRAGSDFHPPLGGDIQDLAFADSGLDQRPLDLGSPPGRLGLGNSAQAVAVHAQPPLDHGGPKPSTKLPLDQLSQASLVLAHMVLGIGLGEADRFPNDHGQLEWDAGFRAQPAEGRRGASCKPIKDRKVEKVEREHAVVDRRGQVGERQVDGR